MQQKMPNPADRDVGARIRSYREFVGMSQQTLASAVGVTFQQIQKYEKGANRVSVGRLLAIATALGTSSNVLIPSSNDVAAGALESSSLFDGFLATPKSAELMRRWIKAPPELRTTVLALLDVMAKAG